jgi:hypothetical protein
MVWSCHGELMQDVLPGRTRSRSDGGRHRRLVRFLFKWSGPGLTSTLLLAGWLVLKSLSQECAQLVGEMNSCSMFFTQFSFKNEKQAFCSLVCSSTASS